MYSGELIGDPSTVIHHLFHLKSGKFRSLIRPLVSGVSKYGVRGVVEGKTSFSAFSAIVHLLVALIVYYCRHIWFGNASLHGAVQYMYMHAMIVSVNMESDAITCS